MSIKAVQRVQLGRTAAVAKPSRSVAGRGATQNRDTRRIIVTAAAGLRHSRGPARVNPTTRLRCAILRRIGTFALLAGIVFAALIGGFPALAKPTPKAEPILLIVMDPLSKELACACVKG